MNGRVYAVNRSPVLTWNVEPPQLQVASYADMPAAAISPIVPAASDPYGRCWQNQVETGSNFPPYFGPLYNNSLPPTAYRLQSGCMPALGQFWPPTPPPDGCGRFDGNNLYFGHPVLRHNENISSNIRSSFQGLGHYSHLVEASKEPTQRLFKRETPISPNVSASNLVVCSSSSKSNILSDCCSIDNKMKSTSSMHYTFPKQELNPASSGHEPYLCTSDIRSSSIHPSTDKPFPPSHPLKNSLNFYSSSQENAHKAKVMTSSQESCNTSPLKNVYFSHYESENINSMHNKNFAMTSDGEFHYDHKNTSPLSGNGGKTRQLHQNFLPSYSYKKCGRQEHHIPYGKADRDGIQVIKEHHKQKSNPYNKVKPEKNHLDCKYQKSTSKIVQGSEYKNSDMFNIPTSVMHPKSEPSDAFFLPTCSSTASSCMAASYATTSPFFIPKDLPVADLRTGVSYQNSIYPNSCSLSKPWHYSDLPAISLDSFFRSPEATKPLSQNPIYVNSSLHEGLISVAQTAPKEIDISRVPKSLENSLAQHASIPRKVRKVSESDDEVQIIGVQTKHSSGKHDSRNSLEIKKDYSKSAVLEPPTLKNERNHEESPKFCPSEEYQPAHPTPPLMREPPSLNPEVSKPNFLDDKSKPETKLTESFSQLPEPLTTLQKSFSPNLLDSGTISPVQTAFIKQELPVESKSSAVSSETIKEEPIDNPQQDILSPPGFKEVPEPIQCLSPVNESKICENQESGFNENHGLNLLLNTIEKVTSFKKTELVSGVIKDEVKIKDSGSLFSDMSNIRGLDLLSAIAEQRLEAEFVTIKSEVDDTVVKCNYPEVKESKVVVEDDHTKMVCETFVNSPKASVSEIQDRLAELKKKYKQKQKELSRLKPKRRFTNSYLKSRQKLVKEESNQSSTSNTSSFNTTENLNSSFTSNFGSDQEMPNLKIEVDIDSESKCGSRSDMLGKKSKHTSSHVAIKRKACSEPLSLHSNKRVTRRMKESGDESKKHPERSRTRRNLKHKACKQSRNLDVSLDNDSSINSKPVFNKDASRKHNSLPSKRKKSYALRHCQNTVQKSNSAKYDSVLHSKIISSKRKSDNPKKYIPSKQNKLSETIIAKHLRSRILFDTSGSMSDDENLKDCVPDDLYIALMECHLSEETKTGNKNFKKLSSAKLSSEGSLGFPAPSRLCFDDMIEGQRLLALEEGLFYAGSIKECQTSTRYGVALDGQRGNRLHIFTQEELLSQVIVESKPLTSELPEGTRVCAYWSQQYRCLYPGVVGKAPFPSADWSEPRVFVLFDDGDSGQIPTKNVRLIPSDIIPMDNITVSDSRELSNRGTRSSTRGHSQRLKCSVQKKSVAKHGCDTSNENESKESSCASINESSCDDSCFVDCSPSHIPEDVENNTSGSLCNSSSNTKSIKRQRKRSKRRASCQPAQFHSTEETEKHDTRAKRHKKYKDKHRKHHHHHHRHHHHHHHHHHSKRRKHKRKTGKTTTPQDYNTPCNVNLKASKNASTDLNPHSSTVNLPQSEQNRTF